MSAPPRAHMSDAENAIKDAIRLLRERRDALPSASGQALMWSDEAWRIEYAARDLEKRLARGV